MDTEKAFWLVWRDGTPYVRYRHETADGAKSEAERLGRANPGQKFHVLRAYGYVLVPDVIPATWHQLTIKGGQREPSDEIPF